MIKYLFILVNSLGLFIFGLFSGDNGIRVTGTIPSEIVVGKEIPVEITLTKGELSGFGRLQIELPEGISIKGAEEKDAEYSFEENKAKWIWASLPDEKEITIKMTLVASESALGEKEINAKFSYVENNQKAFTDMEVARVKVVSADGIAATAAQPVKPAETETAQASNISNAEPPGDIIIDRVVHWNEAGKEYIVTVKIKKGDTKGFARYSDDAHESLSAKSLKTDGSSFSIADGKIKFVWVNVPEKSELEVSYSLSGKPVSPVTINGEYSYLEDNQSKKIKLRPETIDFNSPKKEGTDKKAEEIAANGEKATNTITEEIKKEGETPATATAKTGTGGERKDGKADFHIQVGAFTNPKVSSATLKRKFNINETIRSEMQGGFSKFMIGSHKEYKRAREQRETVVSVNRVKSAFVVAYNDGKRITVQEALMITNQRWFK